MSHSFEVSGKCVEYVLQGSCSFYTSSGRVEPKVMQILNRMLARKPYSSIPHELCDEFYGRN
jgi:hypothetical protein